MPAVIHPNDEKIWDYLLTHKTPVSATDLAKRFLLSQSKVSKTLKSFADQGIADVIQVGKAKYYTIKE